MRTFTRVANMSPGLRDTGDEIAAEHINDLQEGVEDLQTGALPIAPLEHMRAGVANVLDYLPADPDLTGATDYSDQIAAMLSGTQVGTEYYWPAGSYLGGPISISDERHFRLHPGATYTLKDGANTHAITFGSGATGSSISGGIVDANGSHQSGGYGILSQATDITIYDVALLNAFGMGIKATKSRQTIRGCRIVDCGEDAILINVTGQSADITDCQIVGNVIDRASLDPTTVIGKGIGLVGDMGNGRLVLCSVIANNIIHFPVDPTSQTPLTIEVWNGCHQSTIIGNVIAGGSFGISVSGSDYCTVSGNTVQDSNVMAYEIAAAYHCAMSGNAAYRIKRGFNISSQDGRGGYGVVAGNTIDGVDYEAIKVYLMPGMVLSGNAIRTGSSVTAAGINVQGGPGAVIQGNHIDGGGMAPNGVVFDHTDRIAMTGNVIHDVTDAITFYATSGTLDHINVQGNVLYDVTNDYVDILSGGAAFGSDVIREGA